mmetsp:Transcript_14117/g.13717  ORF Transcript_14117/g.13717 Transcript_14117/m.13717 type:complete len:183 (-) Transcript_14117:1409-1957(-)
MIEEEEEEEFKTSQNFSKKNQNKEKKEENSYTMVNENRFTGDFGLNMNEYSKKNSAHFQEESTHSVKKRTSDGSRVINSTKQIIVEENDNSTKDPKLRQSQDLYFSNNKSLKDPSNHIQSVSSKATNEMIRKKKEEEEALKSARSKELTPRDDLQMQGITEAISKTIQDQMSKSLIAFMQTT